MTTKDAENQYSVKDVDVDLLTYTEQEIADACVAAEIPDSKCQSLLIALQEGR